jgi:MFS family permease
VGISASGAAGWAAVGEMSSQRLRPYTAGFAAAISCIAGVVMNQLVPYMINENEWNWGYKTGWFYVGVGIPAVAGMWLLVPETTGCFLPATQVLDNMLSHDVDAAQLNWTSFSITRSVRGGLPRRRRRRSAYLRWKSQDS